MSRIGRALSRTVGLVAAPTVLLALTGFFQWHAALGLERVEQRGKEVAEARRMLASAVADREAAARRVDALRGDAIDQDQLEERARVLLNLTQREEVVIPYSQGRRLF